VRFIAFKKKIKSIAILENEVVKFSGERGIEHVIILLKV